MATRAILPHPQWRLWGWDPRIFRKTCGFVADLSEDEARRGVIDSLTRRVGESFFIGIGPQSIQSARLSLQSSELAPLAPSPASECCPPFGSRVGYTRVRERGGQFGRRDGQSDTLVIL
jgi:hypothetical protein